MDQGHNEEGMVSVPVSHNKEGVACLSVLTKKVWPLYTSKYD